MPVLRWTKETYYRLLINEKIPNNINRILYFDCDIIVNKNLSELYNFNLEDYYIGALHEGNDAANRSRLGLNLPGFYYQCGVILIDLEKSRQILNYNSSIGIIEKIKDSMIAVDQDVVNVMFDSKIKELKEKFNNCKITNYYGNNLNRLFNNVNKYIFNETVVFHYATGKPWNNLYPGSCEKLWYKYLKLSPYSYLYNEKFNNIKYKIIRTGIFKILFFEYIHLTPYINNFFLKLMPTKVYYKMKKFYRNKIK